MCLPAVMKIHPIAEVTNSRLNDAFDTIQQENPRNRMKLMCCNCDFLFFNCFVQGVTVRADS